MSNSAVPSTEQPSKQAVHDHWNAEPCGTRDLAGGDRRAFFDSIERERYTLEPYIADFARFEDGRNKKVLEVGVGAGTDFINWVRRGAIATGIDLTEEGARLTRERLELEGLSAEVKVADAENLPFPDNTFDIVYSYGVLHHSPDTQRAIEEVHRALKPGGQARVMVYHLRSWVVAMVWAVHCLARLRPWKGPRWAVFHHLESPGTKAYTVAEARHLFRRFSQVNVRTRLGHGDLLQMRRSEKYKGFVGKLLWNLHPRWLVRLTGNRFGVVLMVDAVK